MKDILVLFIGAALTSVLFVYFAPNVTLQILILALGCIFYVIWGIIHHAVRERISKEIIFEYILVGALIFLLAVVSLTV